MQTAYVADQNAAASALPKPLGSSQLVLVPPDQLVLVPPDRRGARLVSRSARVNELVRLVLLAGATLMMMTSGCTYGDVDDDLMYEANGDLGMQLRIRQSFGQVELEEPSPHDSINVDFEQFVSSLAPFVEYSANSSDDSPDTASPTSFEAWESANQELLSELEQWMHANILVEGAGPNEYLIELMHTLIFPPADFEIALIAKYGPDWPNEKFDMVFEAEYSKLAALWQEVNMDLQPPWLVLE